MKNKFTSYNKNLTLTLFTFICILLISFSGKGQDVIQSDRDALMALYNYTDGANWSDNTNWGSEEPVSTWYGITVTDDRVTEIDLYSNNLKGIIPPEIGNLTALIDLTMDYNELFGKIPKEIGNLTSLEVLDLGGNKLIGSIPKEIGELGSLELLGLSCNKLEGNIPTTIGNLTSLIYLVLGENELTGNIPTEIGKITSLTELNLYYNQLSGNIPAEIDNLTLLEELDLSQNQLSGSIPSWLGNLTELSTLDLSNNQLSGSIPIEIGELSNLYALYLENNQLTGSIPAEIGNLNNLQELNLSYNQLSEVIPSEIGNLNANFINFSNNQFYGSLPDLSEFYGFLDITNNYFTFEAIEAVVSYPCYTSYFPQYDFQLTTHYIITSQGSDEGLNISQLSVQNLGGANNLYEWFKDGVSLGDPSSNPEIILTGLTEDDFGVYICHVTNTEVMDLELYSEEIYLLEDVPMEITSITTAQSPDAVFVGEANQKVVRVKIVTSGSQVPLTVSDFNFNTNGSTNTLSDINEARLIYTGNNDDLKYGVQFGVDVTADGNFNFTGSQALSFGTNNFWLIYDISDDAVVGDFVDAECNLITVTSVDYTPDVIAPDGNNEILMSDRAALMALYNSTDGLNWTNNSNWGTTQPISTWYGVWAEEGTVLSISLSNNGLKGTIPAEIESFSNAYEINLSNNQLYGSLPDLSGFLWDPYFRIDNNYFTFNAIEDAVSYYWVQYNPQLNFPLNTNEVVAAQGTDVDIDISTISVHNLGGANNLYQWFKDGAEITSVSSNPIINLTSLTADDYGTYTCRVTNLTVLDFVLYSEEIYLRETANAVPTVAEAITDKTEEAGFNSFTVNLSNVFDDTDGDVLSYTISSSNPDVANFVLIGNDLLIVETGAGVTKISIIASDGKGGSVEDEFILNIYSLPIVLNPIPNQTKEEGFGSFTIDLANVFSDADGDELTFSAVSSNTDAVSVTVSENTLTVTEVGYGTSDITVTADDGNNGTVDDVFRVSVNAAGNNPPTILNHISDQIKEEGFVTFTINLDNVFTDVDDDDLTFIAVSSNTDVVSVSVSENTLTVTEAGTGNAYITVNANDGKGGTIDDEFAVIVNVSTSIADIDELNIKIYPNPTSGFIHFESENTEIENIQIYDLTGKLIITKTGFENKEIDLSGISSGVYLVKINTNKKSFTTKIIKE